MNEIEEKIHRRRRQIIVHSLIYYRLGRNIISDATFDSWANELAYLQKKFPKESNNVEYLVDDFRDFSGETGYHLPLNDVKVFRVAHHILKEHRSREDSQHGS